ncbi:hypothetical protein PSTG_19580 [Puccinia striiformis f. sp. tritici PST-78]|uniref:Uncharacterized protein n=1 Tax=Puccinia striiformis f. sp. tritici PST-78 TaxID=1165861 RepID=A0A0L0UIY2_9BASI|nr:hypothetical protein PSTG_19580 [Puccinia striiformis f. sp. tritici PST-78]
MGAGSKSALLKSLMSSNTYFKKAAGGMRSPLVKSLSLSLSNSNLNGDTSHLSNPMAIANAIVSRSNSLREQERKSRNRTRCRSATQRSLSASSEISEGYELGLFS